MSGMSIYKQQEEESLKELCVREFCECVVCMSIALHVHVCVSACPYCVYV